MISFFFGLVFLEEFVCDFPNQLYEICQNSKNETPLIFFKKKTNTFSQNPYVNLGESVIDLSRTYRLKFESSFHSITQFKVSGGWEGKGIVSKIHYKNL
jgi:hypothetical protein